MADSPTAPAAKKAAAKAAGDAAQLAAKGKKDSAEEEEEDEVEEGQGAVQPKGTHQVLNGRPGTGTMGMGGGVRGVFLSWRQGLR